MLRLPEELEKVVLSVLSGFVSLQDERYSFYMACLPCQKIKTVSSTQPEQPISGCKRYLNEINDKVRWCSKEQRHVCIYMTI